MPASAARVLLPSGRMEHPGRAIDTGVKSTDFAGTKGDDQPLELYRVYREGPWPNPPLLLIVRFQIKSSSLLKTRYCFGLWRLMSCANRDAA